MERYVPTLLALVLLVGAVTGYAVGVGAFTDPPPLDEPRVERFERTASGCRGTIDPSGGTTVGPGGRFVSSGVMDTGSPDADLAMEITRTSPDGARITTYRVDLASHAQDGDWNGTCAGEAAYRLNLTVDYREAMRVAVYEEGRAASCGGTGCSAVMADEQRRWWANGTV